MEFNDKKRPNQGGTKEHLKHGGLDRTNPNMPAVTMPGQNQTEISVSNKPEEQELDEQGRATGQMSSHKESNRMAGTSSGSKPSGTPGSTSGGPTA